ncbi:MAG: DNA polymerase III subunit delta [Novosphingobium sp.]
MKASQRDFNTVAARAAAQARVFFFCGPDEAGAQDAAFRIAGLIPDIGERVELSGAELKKDPVRLGDEARSTSLFGDKRHIWVRAQGDEVTEAVQILLSSDVEACPVLIVATGATDKGRTAKLLADRQDALVAMFWPPDLKAVSGAVRDMASAAGLRIDGPIADRIARASGLDTRLAQSEVTKLALFLDASKERPRTADAAALDAIGAATGDDGMMPVVNAVLSGETGKLPAEIRRIKEMNINPVALLLQFERRAAQLAGLASKLGPRGDVRGLIESEKNAKRIFWKDERDLQAQLQRWRGKRLERLVDRLAGLHKALLANSQSAELLLAQELAEIARFAAGKN